MESHQFEAMHDHYNNQQSSTQASSADQLPPAYDAPPRKPIPIRAKLPDTPKDDGGSEPPREEVKEKQEDDRYSESSTDELVEEAYGATCKQCGKSFRSQKELYGHMRLHPSRASPQDGGLKWKGTGRRGRSEEEKEALCLLLEFKAIRKKREIRLPLAGDIEDGDGAERRGKSIKMDDARRDGAAAHACPICSRSFPTHQALGGHVASRNKDRTVDEEGVAKTKKKGAGDGEHRCKVCGVVYLTGQSLGGHMRAHYDPDKKKSPSNPSTAAIEDKDAPAAGPECTVEFLGQATPSERPPHDFDLDETAREEEEMCRLSL